MKASLLMITVIYVTTTWIVWTISQLFNIESALALIAIWIITAMNVTALSMIASSFVPKGDNSTSENSDSNRSRRVHS